MDAGRHRAVAGASLVGASVVTVLAIVTAEALFPGYSTSGHTISALGTTRGSDAARGVFTVAFVAAGLLLVFAARGLHRVFERGPLTAAVALAGAGFVGVAAFPAESAGMSPS